MVKVVVGGKNKWRSSGFAVKGNKIVSPKIGFKVFGCFGLLVVVVRFVVVRFVVVRFVVVVFGLLVVLLVALNGLLVVLLVGFNVTCFVVVGCCVVVVVWVVASDVVNSVD